MRATIHLFGLERCFDLVHVEISEKGKRRGEMLVFFAQSMHHSHTTQFIVRSLQSEGAWAQLLNPGHGLLDSSTKGWEGLFRPLSDGEELVISHKASAGFLLHIERLQCLPSGSGVVLLSSDVNSLVWHQIEHQLSCSAVLFDVPGLLFFGRCAGARLFAIYESPEAFRAQEGLHLFAPGSVVVAIERLNAVIVLLRGHGWEWRRNGASRQWM